MASSDNFEPWISRHIAIPDAWISESFARDADALTKALQFSLSKTTTTPDLIETTPHPKREVGGVNGGKLMKRKSRASKKKSQTTFITADVANFRQMVQLVTGSRCGGSHLLPVPLLKPEPQRPSRRSPPPQPGCFPSTLDTSASLLVDNNINNQRHVVIGPDYRPAGPVSGFDYTGLASAFPALD